MFDMLFDSALWSVPAHVVGGIGIFLLAILMLSEGLQHIGSQTLRTLLARWTKTPLSAMGLGAFATILLQSSSASIAILIGLVNAALLPLTQAIWVVFGANIGTTLTGWLVSLVGLDFNIKAFALPFIGFGMMMRLFIRNGALPHIGTALTGFGLFFIGIDILKDAFSDLSLHYDMESFSKSGVLSLLALVGIGFLATVLTQSSSAAIALILTSSAGGLFDLSAGAALVIGANLGTTSTAVLSVLGATPNAKRLAAAHVLFNIATAFFALLLLPVLLYGVNMVEAFFEIEPNVVISLAIFHTLFNLFGVVLLSPLVPYASKRLSFYFLSETEKYSQPRYIDPKMITMPSIAINALAKELAHFKKQSCKNVIASFSPDPLSSKEENAIATRKEALAQLSLQIAQFSGALTQEKTARDTSRSLQVALRAYHYLQQIVAFSSSARIINEMRHDIKDKNTRKRLEGFLQQCQTIISNIAANKNISSTERQNFFKAYHATKKQFLKSAASEKIDIESLSDILDHLAQTCRMVEKAIKVQRSLDALAMANKLPPENSENNLQLSMVNSEKRI